MPTVMVVVAAMLIPAQVGPPRPQWPESIVTQVGCAQENIDSLVPHSFKFLRKETSAFLYQDAQTDVRLLVGCQPTMPGSSARDQIRAYPLKAGRPSFDETGFTFLETKGDSTVLTYFVQNDLRQLTFGFAFGTGDKRAAAANLARRAVFESLSKASTCPTLRVPPGFWLINLMPEEREYSDETGKSFIKVSCFWGAAKNQETFLDEELVRLRGRYSAGTKIERDRDLIRATLETKQERFAALHLLRGANYFVAAMLAPGEWESKRFGEFRRAVEKAVQIIAAK